MSKPLTYAQREQIERLRKKNQSFSRVADQVGCST